MIASSVAKVLLEKISLPGELLSNFIVIKEAIHLARHFNKSVVFGQDYMIFTVLITLNPLV